MLNRSDSYRLVNVFEFLSDIISVTAGYMAIKIIFDPAAGTRLIYFGLLCCTMFILTAMDAYDDLYSYSTQKTRLPVTVGITLIFSVCAFVCLLFVTGNIKILPAAAYPVYLVVCGFIMIAGRNAVLIFAISARKKRKILIVCRPECPESFLNKLKRNSVDFEKVSVLKLHDEILYSEITDAIDRTDDLLVTADVSDDMRNKIIIYSYQNGKNIKIVPSVESLVMLEGSITHIGDTPVIRVKDGFFYPIEGIIKRGFDFAAALAGLIITSPIFLICAVCIKLDSPGSVFYRQERYTINKKRFNIIKFRTMVNDAEKAGARLATENDDRITRFGRFLRACRLDDLPQLINILKGEMSFVGPRPERPVYADVYSEIVKNYDIRYVVKEGLTGYAQVYGQYNTKVSDKVLFDSIYINNFSLWFDLKLIMQTVMIMFIKESTQGVDEQMADAPKTEKNGV